MENNYKISNHTLMYSKIKTITVQFGSGNNQLQSTSSAMDGDKFIEEV